MLKNSTWYEALMSVQADSQCRSSSPYLVTVFCCSFLDVWIYIVPAVYDIIQLGLPWAREIMLVSTVSFWNWHFYCSLDTKPLAKKELSWWCVLSLFRDAHHIHVPVMIVCHFLSEMVPADSIYSKLAIAEYCPSKLVCWHIWRKQLQSHWRVREYKLQGWLKFGHHC